MSVWPLEADLYLLNAAGQVWRQPLLGDESAAAAVTPLDVVVRDFAVAPGGEWLLYRTDEYVALTAINGLSGQLIAESQPSVPAGGLQGRTMAWSSDASRVVYTTAVGFEVYVPGAGPEFGPEVYPVSEQPVQALAWSDDSRWLLIWRLDGSAALYESAQGMSLWVELGEINGFVWLGDGRLAFAPGEGGLALLDPADLASRVFMVPQERQVSLPGQRPDGSLVFFIHDQGIDQPGTLHVGDPDDLSFREQSRVPVAAASLAWAPTGVRLLGRDTEDTTGQRLVLLDPATGSQSSFTTPGVPIMLDWADPPAQGVAGLAMPADLYFVAPEAGILQVWRLPASGGPPATITRAAADIVDYGISPDGTQVVYTSSGVISRQVIGTLDVTEVATLAADTAFPVIAGTPAFSPTGRQIAYANRGIWVLDLDTGQSRRLAADSTPTQPGLERSIIVYSQPQWSPDGRWLLVRVSYYEGSDHALLSTTGEVRDPIFLNTFAADARWATSELALIFSGGGAYSSPALTLMQPGPEPVLTPLLAEPVVAADLRADGRLVYLRIPAPYGIGPTSLRLYSALLNGGDVRSESSAFVMDSPSLSPNGILIAGLVGMRVNPQGRLEGQLAVANPGTGEVFTITGMTAASDLQWGR